MNDVLQALRELTAIFDHMQLTYAVIGGVAVRAYGIPRPTYDVDFTLAIPRERLTAFYELIEDRGHSVLESYRGGWVDQVAGMSLIKLRTYIQSHGIDVDVFLAESRFQSKLLERRQLVETPDGAFWLASPEDIILLKLLASRDRDNSDVLDIMFAQGQLDETYLRDWAEQLAITGQLEKALEKNREMS